MAGYDPYAGHYAHLPGTTPPPRPGHSLAQQQQPYDDRTDPLLNQQLQDPFATPLSTQGRTHVAEPSGNRRPRRRARAAPPPSRRDVCRRRHLLVPRRTIPSLRSTAKQHVVRLSAESTTTPARSRRRSNLRRRSGPAALARTGSARGPGLVDYFRSCAGTSRPNVATPGRVRSDTTRTVRTAAATATAKSRVRRSTFRRTWVWGTAGSTAGI